MHYMYFNLIPSPSHPSFCLAAMEVLFLHGCETKVGVGRTGNEASISYNATAHQPIRAGTSLVPRPLPPQENMDSPSFLSGWEGPGYKAK